jgi:hypothetical protein
VDCLLYLILQPEASVGLINGACSQAAIQISNPVPFVDLAQSVALDGYRNRNKAGK